MHTDYVSMGGKNFFTPLFLPYIRSTLEVHFFDFILGRATPKSIRNFMEWVIYFFCILSSPKKMCRSARFGLGDYFALFFFFFVYFALFCVWEGE